METPMSYDTQKGREDLLAFEREQPDNFWRADPHLQRVVRHWAGEDAVAAWEDDLDRFGGECAGPIDRAVRENNLNHNLPVLRRWGPYGDRIEEVEHHPSYHEAGRMIYGSGVMTALGEAGGNLRSQTLGFLSALNGEAGHNCPLACTAGVIKVMRALGSDELKERYLPRLLSRNYEQLAHGAQFLTEVQGGSDVGANSVRAVPGDDVTWRIHGEKWFCSNVTADLILMTARPEGAPEGTRGLGLFLVPRRTPDGEINRFFIRQLKDKLGTRSMASAELDFDGAFAWAMGPVEDGFKNMMTHVINTSRVFNAVGTSGIARRACYIAHGYATRRKAFGPSLIEYPLVQETLADMRSETAAMTSGTFYLLHLMDRLDRGEAGDEEIAFIRMAVNLNKMRSAQSSHDVTLSGVEMLAGNGAIESFSVLPRLIRDNIVFENWEGAHNVLLVQVLRDARRLALHEPFLSHLKAQAGEHPRIAGAIDTWGAEMSSLLAEEDAAATLRIRQAGGRLAWIQWAAAMLADGTEPALIEHFLDRRIGPEATRDSAYLERIRTLSGLP
jgi:acyl-CoA dehydrogenase